jgi:hypothetical protein
MDIGDGHQLSRIDPCAERFGMDFADPPGAD